MRFEKLSRQSYGPFWEKQSLLGQINNELFYYLVIRGYDTSFASCIYD